MRPGDRLRNHRGGLRGAWRLERPQYEVPMPKIVWRSHPDLTSAQTDSARAIPQKLSRIRLTAVRLSRDSAIRPSPLGIRRLDGRDCGLVKLIRDCLAGHLCRPKLAAGVV